MMIGSVTKSTTTFMMATVVDDRKMAWDTPVAEIYPDFALIDSSMNRKITMRNLVCACIGIPRRDIELTFTSPKTPPQEVIGSLRSFELATPPGEAFQYNNQLVAAAGYIAALAAGAKKDDLFAGYTTEMEKRVFRPIGMSNTTFSIERVVAKDNYAMPHAENLFNEYSAVPVKVEELFLPVAPSGSIWSNAIDMSRYLFTEIHEGVAPNGERVVSAENLKATWTPQVQAAPNASYGLGWGIGEYKGQRMIQHNGEPVGFTSDMAFLPDAGIGIVVISNSSAARQFNSAVRMRLFELAFGLPMENDARFSYQVEQRERAALKKDSVDDVVDQTAVTRYLHRFLNPALGQISIQLEGGRLLLKTESLSSELRRLRVTPGNQYAAIDSPLAGLIFEFTQDQSASPMLAMHSGTETWKFSEQQ